MAEEEKGIYVSIQHYIKGEVYEQLKKSVEEEVRAWVRSDAGRLAIGEAVRKSIHDHVGSFFGWYQDKDPNVAKFKKIITDEIGRVMIQAVDGIKLEMHRNDSKPANE